MFRLHRSPHASASSRRLPVLCLLLFSAALVPVSSQETIELPEIGDSSSGVLSPELEQRLGKAVMRSLRQHADIVDDPEIESYISSLGYQLVANSHNNTLEFTFFVIDNSTINAFAAPGGVIGVNSGTILNSRNESELAAVVAHEIAHVTQRHIARRYEQAGQMRLPQMAALIGAILLGVVGDAETGAAAATLVSGVSVQQQINFTRTNEEEADNIGIQLLVDSGFDPQGMPSFFERLLHQSRYTRNNAPEFLRTHPLTTSRISNSKARASQFKQNPRKSSISYELARIKLEVAGHENHQEAVILFRSRLSGEEGKPSAPARYGYALALLASGEHQMAGKQARLLLTEDEENSAYLLLAARIEAEQGNYDAAFDIYRKTYHIYPDYRPLVLAYARSLLNAGRASQARDLLLEYRRQQAPGTAYYELLSQAEAENGSPANSGIAKAEYFYLIGNTKLAIERLKQAQREGPLDYYQEQIITTRIQQLEYELELEQRLQI